MGYSENEAQAPKIYSYSTRPDSNVLIKSRIPVQLSDMSAARRKNRKHFVLVV